jgi:hypothetical protein
MITTTKRTKMTNMAMRSITPRITATAIPIEDEEVIELGAEVEDGIAVVEDDSTDEVGFTVPVVTPLLLLPVLSVVPVKTLCIII